MNDSLGNIQDKIKKYSIIFPIDFNVEVLFDKCYISINDYSISMFLVKKIVSFLFDYDYYFNDIEWNDNYFKLIFVSNEL
jgi:hypothetical protein